MDVVSFPDCSADSSLPVGGGVDWGSSMVAEELAEDESSFGSTVGSCMDVSGLVPGGVGGSISLPGSSFPVWAGFARDSVDDGSSATFALFVPATGSNSLGGDGGSFLAGIFASSVALRFCPVTSAAGAK